MQLSLRRNTVYLLGTYWCFSALLLFVKHQYGLEKFLCLWGLGRSFHFESAAVAVDSHHMTASLSTSWSRFSPPSNFVDGHVSTMSTLVCRWPQSQEGNLARPHLCKFARHRPWPVWKQFNRDHVRWGRSKPGCQIVGSVTIVWLTAEAEDQVDAQHTSIHRPIWMGFDNCLSTEQNPRDLAAGYLIWTNKKL